jgi:hypothetical protein
MHLQQVLRVFLATRQEQAIGAYWPIKGEFDALPALPVRVVPPPFGRGRTRYVVDATPDRVLLVVAGLAEFEPRCLAA